MSSWEQLDERLHHLRSEDASARHVVPGHVSDFLYRGQSDSTWSLSTTLERSDLRNLSLRHYFRLISGIKRQIEDATGTVWAVPDFPTYEEWLTKREHLAVAPPGYEYMAYLRHHGFPSPLLDWTRSLQIAAYFAFRWPRLDAKTVAIFVYSEYRGAGKSWISSEPHLHGLGSSIQTHHRHHAQQSEYTVCLSRGDEWRYASHEDAFAAVDPGQDALWKFSLPATERLKVLRSLDIAGINAHSLFGTEDALLETIAFRELEARRSDL